ncbi:MAG: nucleotide exchange factor GrpE [Pseudohongiellaceae bacterium]
MQTPNEQNEQDQSDNQAQDEVVNPETGSEAPGNPDQSGENQTLEDKTEVELLQEKLEAAELAAGQAKDDLLRVQAEMQNLRRRTEQDVEKAHKYGQEKFAGELLAVMDNLERALNSASGSEDATVKAIYDGVDLTLKSFAACFTKFNIESLDPLGEPFDPLVHQAMSMQENPDVEPNTVIAVMQKGYSLHGRVIRPAMVMVSKGPAAAIDETA